MYVVDLDSIERDNLGHVSSSMLDKLVSGTWSVGYPS